MPEIGERHSRMEEIPIKGDDIQIAQDSPRNFDQKFEEFSEIVLGDSESESREVQEFSVEDDDESSEPEIEEIKATMTEEKRMDDPIADGQQERKSSLNSSEPSPLLMSCAGVVLGDGQQGCSDPTICWGISVGKSQIINLERFSECSSWQQLENATQRQEFQMQSGSSEVIPYPLAVVVLKELDEKDVLMGTIAVRAKNSDAYNLFVEMPRIDMEPFQEIDAVIGKPRMVERNLIFDPGISVLVIGMGFRKRIFGLFLDLKLVKIGLRSLPYDRGKSGGASIQGWFQLKQSAASIPGKDCVVQTEKPRLVAIQIFDPGEGFALMVTLRCSNC